MSLRPREAELQHQAVPNDPSQAEAEIEETLTIVISKASGMSDDVSRFDRVCTKLGGQLWMRSLVLSASSLSSSRRRRSPLLFDPSRAVSQSRCCWGAVAGGISFERCWCCCLGSCQRSNSWAWERRGRAMRSASSSHHTLSRPCWRDQRHRDHEAEALVYGEPTVDPLRKVMSGIGRVQIMSTRRGSRSPSAEATICRVCWPDRSRLFGPMLQA